MNYPDKFPAGSDLDQVWINRDNRQSPGTPDFDGGILNISDEPRFTDWLTGMQSCCRHQFTFAV